MAACPANLGECLKFQDSTASKEYTGIGGLINNVLPNIYVAAGLLLFFMIVIGGFTIIMNANDSHKMEEGKKTITTAIIGLLVLFGSYWMIQIIQVVTGVAILNVKY